MESYSCAVVLCMMELPVFFCCGVHIDVALFGDGERVVFVILVAPYMLPGPPQWCFPDCCPCRLDKVEVFG